MSTWVNVLLLVTGWFSFLCSIGWNTWRQNIVSFTENCPKSPSDIFQSILCVFSPFPWNCSAEEFYHQSEQSWQGMNEHKPKRLLVVPVFDEIHTLHLRSVCREIPAVMRVFPLQISIPLQTLKKWLGLAWVHTVHWITVMKSFNLLFFFLCLRIFLLPIGHVSSCCRRTKTYTGTSPARH